VRQHRVPTVLLTGLLGLDLNHGVVRAQFPRVLAEHIANVQKSRCENAQADAEGVEQFQRRKRTRRVTADWSKFAAVGRAKDRCRDIPACAQQGVALANATIYLPDVRERNSLRYNALGDARHLSRPLSFQQTCSDTSAGRRHLLEVRPVSMK
jgi:hypothetical protein